MAASPKFKVYLGTGEYIASFKYAEDAANFSVVHATTGKIKLGHSLVVWDLSNITPEQDAAILAGYDQTGDQIAADLAVLGFDSLGNPLPGHDHMGRKMEAAE